MVAMTTETTLDERLAEAQALRAYAKEQGRLARQYAKGVGVPYYRMIVHRGTEVRATAPENSLSADERDRQRREFAKMARDARTEANRKAKQLESQ